MAANKQCPYRSQEHNCTHTYVFHTEEWDYAACNLCMAGQKVDAIELVASAIMERVMK